MQSSLNLEEMLGDWSPNTGDDTSILGTQKITFLLHNVLGGCLQRKLLNIIGQKNVLHYLCWCQSVLYR